MLAGSSNEWSQASPKAGDGWFNYTLEAMVKVIKGEIQIQSRTSDRPYRSGYILNINEHGLHLGRDINGVYTHLTNSAPFMEYGRWYQIRIILDKTNIKVYLDDELKLDCTDNDLPLIFGRFNFNIAPHSLVLFDNINVEVH